MPHVYHSRTHPYTRLYTQLLKMLNRSLCEIVETSDDVSGLFNFSWDSETSLSFVTPCALWAANEYGAVSAEL